MKCEEPGAESCTLVFTREDGEIFPVADNASLLDRVIGSAGELAVRVKGKKTPKFLFWGNRLVVENFEVLD
ncbi:MAG: hypothetical protein H6617_00710 [Bdellovibrionaceae bacterium]|nr:hypothetical protein [Pseudobdellovibrionaceae bacterium]